MSMTIKERREELQQYFQKNVEYNEQEDYNLEVVGMDGDVIVLFEEQLSGSNSRRYMISTHWGTNPFYIKENLDGEMNFGYSSGGTVECTNMEMITGMEMMIKHVKKYIANRESRIAS